MREREQREKLDRGLIAAKVPQGVFLSWRLKKEEAFGYSGTGLTGVDFYVCRNGERIARVCDSTNYLDREGTPEDVYSVAGILPDGRELEAEGFVRAFPGGNYIDIPVQRPAGGVTPAGEAFTYLIGDMSVGDVNGDGAYEYIVKWDPTNAHDVSHRGYTGNCILDCYTLEGRLLWRMDMGPNIRAGAHYTQFMVFDFDGDGLAEIALKTAPGTRITRFGKEGGAETSFITLPAADRERGVTNDDNYVCSAADYRRHLAEVFRGWREHDEVKAGRWPDTLEACFGVERRYDYPLSLADAEALADYFIGVYAPSRSGANHLEQFEGFIYEGPEYLSIFSGGGEELETIPFPFPRQDDGLLWGDYCMPRIEPCNRVDRFLAGVAYLDGLHPSLIVSRGYYTRTAIAAYDFDGTHLRERWLADSGHVPMKNPFRDDPADKTHLKAGTDAALGRLAGQGNHSLSVADVDGDGRDEIIFGAACVDDDGTLLYSSYDRMPDGRLVKLGHGDSMHVAKIDPDREGFQIFNVFEGASEVPYGFALRDAATGEVLAPGEGVADPGAVPGKIAHRAAEDLGRCMIGDIDPDHRGLELWVNQVFSCRGEPLDLPAPSTNQAIRFAADLSTQLIDDHDALAGGHRGVIRDFRHGVLLDPQGTRTNNGTKGNPCIVADLFGDFREEIALALTDESAIRIYTGTEVTGHKLYTPMHDRMYRTGIAWQNTAYNQTCYTSYYYASDMDFSKVPLDRG